MKNSLYKNRQGFTIVEFLVLVVLSSTLLIVGYQNFIFYQAKDKHFEAVVQLAQIYSLEISTHNDYKTYTTCLTSMGYEPPPEGFYLIGFSKDDMVSINQVNSTPSGLCEPGEFAIKPEIFQRTNDLTPYPTAESQLARSRITSSHFTAVASGNISPDIPYDIWTIDEEKKLTNIVIGYREL